MQKANYRWVRKNRWRGICEVAFITRFIVGYLRILCPLKM